MSNLTSFLSNFDRHNGFSKTCRFEVEIPYAPVGSGRDLTFQCEVAELPGYNINTVDGLVYGAPYAIAATPVYNELNLTFICAADMWEKKFFDAWLEYILPQRDYRLKYRDEYATFINVKQFTETGQIAYYATFIDAFPNTTAPITLNWADDGINRLSVGFKYRSWKAIPVENSLSGGTTLSSGSDLLTGALNTLQPFIPQSTFQPLSSLINTTTGLL